MTYTKNYYIKSSYHSRLNNLFFDDTQNKDEWQKEVYEYAKKKFQEHNLQKVIDIGCGSGFKLITNFSDHDTLGIDLPETVSWLNKKYPTKKWSSDFKAIPYYDMVICSDVIEHIPDPDTLLDLISECNTKLIVLSTPDRDLLNNPNGPPCNPSHVREWNMIEFSAYIGSRFDIIEHFISNQYQCTQVILAKPRNPIKF